MRELKKILTKHEPRNVGVTVVSGVMTLLFAAFSFYLLTNSQALYGVIFSIISFITLAVALYGRKSLFTAMAELLFWIA